MNEVQRTMYSGLLIVRNNEVNLRWTRNQLFFFMNSAALSLVATQMSPDNPFFGIACCLGMALSLLWLRMIFIIRSWVNYWDNTLAALEGLEGEPVRIFQGEEWNQQKKMRYGVNFVLTVVTLIFSLVWFGMLVWKKWIV